MASRPDKNGDFIVQQDEESNDENMEDVINIDNIEIEKGVKSKKECMILKILEEKDDKYLVLWNNQTKSWVAELVFLSMLFFLLMSYFS